MGPKQSFNKLLSLLESHCHVVFLKLQKKAAFHLQVKGAGPQMIILQNPHSESQGGGSQVVEGHPEVMIETQSFPPSSSCCEVSETLHHILHTLMFYLT